MSNPISPAELAALAEALAPKPRTTSAPHDPMPAIARGLGWFARPSEHEHRLRLERSRRR